ncbi:MAG TPA: mannose-1-phosphate guanylyltransferase [Anaerolineae bacterium]|nr:mannose-1-phosphate guanylyltransferase [Anaerolineae bacterium]
MTDHFYALIMAGGVGSRLWPLSRQKSPKQVLPLMGEHSMFTMAVQRLQPLLSPANVLVVVGEEQVDLLKAEGTGIPERNFVIEPEGHGTAPAIALSAITLRRCDPEAIMAVLTADHFIGDDEGFRGVLAAAHEVAARDHLVTLGVTPSSPSTGYGYIERGQYLMQANDYLAYKVVAFREKPDLVTAKHFVTSGRHSWNSGMFVWKVSRFLDELSRTMPEFYQQLMTIEAVLGTPDYDRVLHTVWKYVKTQTVDYGVMEKARDVAVIPAEFGWNDVGSWATLLEILDNDEHGNVIRHAEHVGVDTTNSLVFGRDRLVATIGLHDMIVIDTGDAVLVCPKDRAQDVKKIVDNLKQQKKAQFL